jgi:predicted transcriptional regulator
MPMGRQKPEEKRAKPNRQGKPLNVWLDDDLRNALDEMVKRSRRSITAEVSIALEEYLAKQGLWPAGEKD